VIAFVFISCSIAIVLLFLCFLQALSQDLDGMLADANGFSFALDKVGNLGKGKGLGKDKGLGKGKGKPLALKDRENQEDGEAQPDEAALLEDAFAKARKCRSLVLVSSASFEDALLQMKKTKYWSRKAQFEAQEFLDELKQQEGVLKKILIKDNVTLAQIKEALATAAVLVKKCLAQTKELKQLALKSASVSSSKRGGNK